MEHPRFPVNVADLACPEMGLWFWTGTGGSTTFNNAASGASRMIPGRSYADFRAQAAEELRSIADAVREYCASMDGAVEDVRMHRVVFGRGMSFRWFADMSCDSGCVLLKLQRGRKEQPAEVRLKDMRDIDSAKEAILDAFGRA